MTDLRVLSWPLARLGEALEALARHAGLLARTVEIPVVPEGILREPGESVGRWIESSAIWMGIEAEPAEAPYAEVERMVRASSPALFRFALDGETRFLAVLNPGRVLAPDLTVHREDPETIRSAICASLEAPLATAVDRLLEEGRVAADRRPRARVAILRERLSAARIGGCWLLRLPPGSSFWRQARQARLPRRLAILLGGHTVQYVLWLVAWAIIGQGALGGRLDKGWMIAWLVLLMTLVPLRSLVTWTQGTLAIGAGGLLKLRMLAGALRLNPDEIRHQGAGQLLGRVMESEAVESLALTGGFLALVSVIELAFSGAVLWMAGTWSVLLLAVWVALTLGIGWRYSKGRFQWTTARVEMTHDLVERMVGHRTRVAQEVPERWHDGEDQTVEHYLALSKSMDRKEVLLTALIPRGWLLFGLIGLAFAFVSGGGVAVIAVGLGGILMAYRGLAKLTSGVSHLTGAAFAWRQVSQLFHAAARPELPGSPVFAVAGGGDGAVLEARDLVFRYADRGQAVLRGCSVRIGQGDRLLLEGPSGGGKSTLVSLMIGMRTPESGLLLLRGLDRHTLGSEHWRRRVVAAPQFHENHVLTETFAFNALMGRRWPPEAGDMEEAEAVCRELGLGDLLGRMPAGLLQMVGESGWQLSHGERSRLYIARALLQGAEVILLDESFAALDPENLRRALECVLRRAKTVMVIAHP